MSKQFELLLVRRDPEDAFKFKSSHKIVGDSLMEILQQLNFVIVRVCEDLKNEELAKEKQKGWEDDEIPF